MIASNGATRLNDYEDHDVETYSGKNNITTDHSGVKSIENNNRLVTEKNDIDHDGKNLHTDRIMATKTTSTINVKKVPQVNVVAAAPLTGKT